MQSQAGIPHIMPQINNYNHGPSTSSTTSPQQPQTKSKDRLDQLRKFRKSMEHISSRNMVDANGKNVCFNTFAAPRKSSLNSSKVKKSKKYVNENHENTQPSQHASASGRSDSHDKCHDKLKCYKCKSDFDIRNYTDHLIFGRLKCSQCKMMISNCEQWQTFINLSPTSHDCIHDLGYIGKPADFIFQRVRSVPGINNNIPERILGDASAQIMFNFAFYVKVLEQVRPKAHWNRAMIECIDFIEKNQCGRLFGELKKLNNFSNIENGKRSMNLDGERTENSSRFNVVYGKQPNKIPKLKITKKTLNTQVPNIEEDRHSSYSMSSVPKGNAVEGYAEEYDFGEGLLEEDYSMANLEQVVEYHHMTSEFMSNSETALSPNSDRLSENSKDSGFFSDFRSEILGNSSNVLQESSNHGESSLIPHKSGTKKSSKKGKREMKLTNRKRHTTPQGTFGHISMPSFEYIDTPSDDRYYVSHELLDQCPDCYEHLEPTGTTINLQTLMATTICLDCGLTIYHIPDVPGSTVSVVTGTSNVDKVKKAKKLTASSFFMK